MKSVQKELTAISTALASLSQQVEKLAAAIDADTAAAAPEKKAKAPVKKAKSLAKRANTSAKKRAAKKTAPSSAKAKAAPAANPKGETMLDNIFGVISRSRKGITVAQLKKRTGLEKRQVSNALYKLSNKGKIEAVSRGVYVKKKK